MLVELIPKVASIFQYVTHWEISFFDIQSKKNFFELKKFLLIQKKFLWSKKTDLFRLKKKILNQQNFQFKDIFSLTVYQINVSLIQRNCSLGAWRSWIISFCTALMFSIPKTDFWRPLRNSSVSEWRPRLNSLYQRFTVTKIFTGWFQFFSGTQLSSHCKQHK